MTPTDVRDRLDDRFRLLAGGRRGLERHQTLRNTVASSYELLITVERVDGHARCGMLETIGQFAEGRLADTGSGLSTVSFSTILADVFEF